MPILRQLLTYQCSDKASVPIALPMHGVQELLLFTYLSPQPDLLKKEKLPGTARMYYIAQVLPPDLDKPIQRIKEDLHQQFGCAVGLKSPAHITLIPPFWLSSGKEGLIKGQLRHLAARTDPFPLRTEGFDSFGKRTFFVAVAHSEALHQLKAQADLLFTALPELGLKKESRPFHPHITVATRDLRPADFDTAWNQYRYQSFRGSWLADAISLLRHNGKNWDVVATEMFRPANS